MTSCRQIHTFTHSLTSTNEFVRFFASAIYSHFDKASREKQHPWRWRWDATQISIGMHFYLSLSSIFDSLFWPNVKMYRDVSLDQLQLFFSYKHHRSTSNWSLNKLNLHEAWNNTMVSEESFTFENTVRFENPDFLAMSHIFLSLSLCQIKYSEPFRGETLRAIACLVLNNVRNPESPLHSPTDSFTQKAVESFEQCDSLECNVSISN